MRTFADALSVSLALSLLAARALPAASVASPRSMEALTFGRLASPWGTAVSTERLMELRGGGIFGGKKSAARIYKDSLEEQVSLLNEQLSHARTEVATLRENAKKRHQAGSSLHRAKPTSLTKEEQKAAKEQAKQEEKLEKLRQKDQKEALARFQKEIKQLEQMKSELEKMLETSAKKIETLEEQLASQEDMTAKMEASFKEQIAKLEEQLASIQAAQEEKLTEIQQEKIDAAVLEALRAQEVEFRVKMEETTKRLTKEHAKEMEQEKIRSAKAVEAERKKMRKLVRALALREKKLKLQTPKEESTTKEKTPVKTRTSSQQKQFVPPTSRGTI